MSSLISQSTSWPVDCLDVPHQPHAAQSSQLRPHAPSSSSYTQMQLSPLSCSTGLVKGVRVMMFTFIIFSPAGVFMFFLLVLKQQLIFCKNVSRNVLFFMSSFMVDVFYV